MVRKCISSGSPLQYGHHPKASFPLQPFRTVPKRTGEHAHIEKRLINPRTIYVRTIIIWRTTEVLTNQHIH